MSHWNKKKWQQEQKHNPAHRFPAELYYVEWIMDNS